MVRVFLITLFFITSVSFIGCGSALPFEILLDDDETTEGSESTEDEESSGIERDISGKLALAIGGVAADTDVILTSEDLAGKTLNFETEDEDLISFAFVNGFNNFIDGSNSIPISSMRFCVLG